MDILTVLPEELCIFIFCQLDIADLNSVLQTCHTWNDFIQNTDLLWKTLFKTYFGNHRSLLEKSKEMSWKDVFRINHEANKVKKKWLTGEFSNISSFSELPAQHFCRLPAEDWGDILDRELQR